MKDLTICFLTPTYSGDFERFLLLRESMEACDIDIRHIAVVQTEDIAQFRNLPHSKNLTLLTTADVLPGWLERRRAAWFMGRRNPRKWLAGPPMDGWNAQMYSKLAAAEFCDADVVVCVDSDMAFVRPVGSEHFHTGGQVHLYRFQESFEIEMIEWVGRSMRFLGVRPTGLALRTYTYSPVPLATAVLSDMRKHIEHRYSKHWLEAIVAAPWVTEYATYGAFAEHVDMLSRVQPLTPSLAGWCWWKQESESLDSRLREIADDKRIRVVGVQSNLKIDTTHYAEAIRRLWKTCRI